MVSNDGHKPWNISRDTAPWSRDPVGPLGEPKHITAMLNLLGSPPVVLSAQCQDPVQRQILKTRELVHDQLAGKRSMPAGTG